MSKDWIKVNSRHPDNCQEHDVIFADVVEVKLAELREQVNPLHSVASAAEEYVLSDYASAPQYLIDALRAAGYLGEGR